MGIWFGFIDGDGSKLRRGIEERERGGGERVGQAGGRCVREEDVIKKGREVTGVGLGCVEVLKIIIIQKTTVQTSGLCLHFQDASHYTTTISHLSLHTLGIDIFFDFFPQ